MIDSMNEQSKGSERLPNSRKRGNMFEIRKTNRRLGQYPCADHLNLALNYLLKEKNLNVGAVEEICYALEKAGAYYYEYVLDLLIERGIKKEEFKDNVKNRG